MSEDLKLDGTDEIKPVPFDAHEQVVRKPHRHTKAAGYVNEETRIAPPKRKAKKHKKVAKKVAKKATKKVTKKPEPKPVK